METAMAAAMSDPLRNPAFRRRWREPAEVAWVVAPKPVMVITSAAVLEQTGLELLAAWRQERAGQAGAP